MEDKIIKEYKGTKVYVNIMTKNINEYAKREDLNGIKLNGWNTFALKYSNGYEEYVLYNDKGVPIKTSQRAEDIGVYIDMIKARIHFDREN